MSLIGVLTLPAWTRAPLLGLRQPAAFLAVAVATMILACASASGWLFLSSADSGSLQAQSVGRCPDTAWPMVGTSSTLATGPGGRPISSAETDQAYPRAMAAEGLASTPVLIGRTMTGTTPGGSSDDVRPLYRPAALDNVDVLDRRSGAGVYLPSLLAEEQQVAVGDRYSISGVDVPVVGVYRSLSEDPAGPYWCSYREYFVLDLLSPAPPELILTTDPQTFYELAAATDGEAVTGPFAESSIRRWEAPVDVTALSRTSTEDLLDRQNRAYRVARAEARDGQQAEVVRNENLADFLDRAARLEAGLHAPVFPTAIAGTVLALGLVAAAGGYWADRRLREVRLLSARGVGPGALAIKSGLELAAPAVLGTVAGYYLARGLVMLVGPADELDPRQVSLAIRTVGAALILGLVLLCLVAGLRARNSTERSIGRRRSRLSALPVELGLIGAAGYLLADLGGDPAVVFDGPIATIDGRFVAAPLLLLAGTVILIVRLLSLGLPALTRWARTRSAATFLAVSQLTASRLAASALLVALCLPVGVFVYSATLTSSSQLSVTSKAYVAVGAEYSVTTFGDLATTSELTRAGTLVSRFDTSELDGREVTGLGVDPETFAGTAYWQDRFADDSLSELLARLPTEVDGRVPAIATGDLGLGPAELRLGSESSQSAVLLEVDIVAHADVLPGRRSVDPTVLFDSGLIDAEIPAGVALRNEIWTNDDPAAALTVLRDQDQRLFRTFTVAEVFEQANFLGVSWTFGYLTALAAFIGLIAVGGLALYLEARLRRRAAAHALAHRMGLSRPAQFRSLLVEFGATSLVALLLGGVIAAGAIAITYRRLETDPIRAPTPLLSVPWLGLGALVLAAIAVWLGAALYTRRRVGGIDPATVLRLDG